MSKVVIYRSTDAERLRASDEWLARLGEPSLRLDLQGDGELGVLVIIDQFNLDQAAIDWLCSDGRLELYESWDERQLH